MQVKTGSFSDPGDPRQFRWYNFDSVEEDPEIPVVLVFVTRHILHAKENYQPGPEVLFMRRGFLVGALQGQWSPIAGVDDLHMPDNPEEATRQVVLAELEDEAGITDLAGEVTYFGKNHYPDPRKPGRTYVQQLFHVQANYGSVVVDWENIGSIWVPISAVAEYLETGLTDNPHMSVVIDDGTTMIEDGNLARFKDYFSRTYR